MAWTDTLSQILESLDIQAEYKAWGVRFPDQAKASDKGWLSCHSPERDDTRPSAAIFVGHGPKRGRFTDRAGTGLSLSFFDAAVRFSPQKFKDWRAARLFYARQTKTTLPRNDKSTRFDSLAFTRFSENAARIWCIKKPPIQTISLALAGARMARYPAQSPNPQSILALPVFANGDPDADPSGWAMVNLDGGTLALYQGPGKEYRHEKVLLAKGSTPGLLNPHALRSLATAKVVWKVEGVTDLLALLSAIPEPLRGTHLVLTNSNGANEIPLPAWLELLHGKTVNIVHDCDTPGQSGAARWICALASRSTVRNVVLPFPIVDKHGQDLRDYLVDNTYSTLLDFALATPVSTPDTLPTTTVSPEQEMLAKYLSVEVLGEAHDGRIECYSSHCKKLFTIQSIGRLSYPELLQHVGEPAQQNVTEFMPKGDLPTLGKFTMPTVRNAIGMEASRVRLTDKAKLGAGLWKVDGSDDIVIVNSGAAASWDGNKLRPITTPRLGTSVLDFSPSESWCDFAKLGRYATNISSSFISDTYDETVALFSNWYWKWPNDPHLITSLIMASWVQTLWSWRPLVAIAGGSDSGKSMMMEGALSGLFGSLGLLLQKPSEAALRQAINNKACITLIDEFENDRHRAHVLELVRVSSRGGSVFRGTADQRGRSFSLRHIVWVSSIEAGLKREADKNRFVTMDLKKPPSHLRGKFHLPSRADLNDLGIRLLACSLHLVNDCSAIANRLKGEQIENVPGRAIESFAVPAALCHSASQRSTPPEEVLRWLIDQRYQDANKESDEEELLHDILSCQIIVGGGQTTVPSEVLTDAEARAFHRDTLERNGLSFTTTRRNNQDEVSHVFFSVANVQRYLLRGTRWDAGIDIESILLRCPDAQRMSPTILGKKQRGVLIPVPYLLGITKQEPPIQRKLFPEKEPINGHSPNGR